MDVIYVMETSFTKLGTTLALAGDRASISSSIRHRANQHSLSYSQPHASACPLRRDRMFPQISLEAFVELLEGVIRKARKGREVLISLH